MNRPLFKVALLLALTALVYADVGRHPFVRLDDFTYVTGNPIVRGGVTAAGVRWAATTFHEANWHPLTWLSHMLDVSLFGMNAGRHHLVNLLLHATNAALLLLVLTRMTGAPWRCFLVAALFAVHPLHVESVAWVAERKDLLSALFWILAVLAYARYAARRSTTAYLAVVLLFACSLLAKPMGVTLPFALLLFDIWPLHRIALDRDGADAPRFGAAPLRRLVVEKLPLLALALASSIVTVAAQAGGASVVPLAVIPLATRAGNAVATIAAYLGKTFVPASLAVFYPHPWYLGGLPAGRVIAATLLLCGVSLLALLWARRRPYAATGWFLFIGMLIPVIGLVQVGSQAMADRYTYLPLIGVFIVLAWGTADLAAALRLGRFAPAALWGAAILTLAVVARGQVAIWRSDDALFAHAIEVAPSWLVHTNFGEVLQERGESAAAAAHYRDALRLAPGDTVARHHLADIFAQSERFDEAIVELEAALRARPEDAIARYKLGSLLFRQGRTGEAIAAFRETLARAPDDTETRSNLGVALMAHGEIDEAITQLRETLRRSPGDPVALQNLDKALGRVGAPLAGVEAGTR